MRDVWITNPYQLLRQAIKGNRRKVYVEHLSHKVEFASQQSYDISFDLPSAESTTGSVSRGIRVKQNSGKVISYHERAGHHVVTLLASPTPILNALPRVPHPMLLLLLLELPKLSLFPGLFTS